jgi:hypothetical protein
MAHGNSGVLMRVVEMKEGASPGSTHASPQSPCPNVERIYTAVADDDKKPS